MRSMVEGAFVRVPEILWCLVKPPIHDCHPEELCVSSVSKDE